MGKGIYLILLDFLRECIYYIGDYEDAMRNAVDYLKMEERQCSYWMINSDDF